MIVIRSLKVIKYVFVNTNWFILASSKQRKLPEDWDHFHVLLEQLLHRVPSLKSVVLDRLCNGPEAFSPDCKWIVGEAPEVSFCSIFFKYKLKRNNSFCGL